MLAAVVQLTCTSDEAGNLASAESLIRDAARKGAQLIATPEATNYLGPHRDKVRRAQALDGPLTQRLSALSRELGVHLLIGSINEKSADPERCFNTSLLLGPDGSLLGRYRKIHLFDVDVSDEVRFLESNTAVAGEEPVVVDTSIGRIGLSICYDLRFPGLYQELVRRGAQILAVPSAFTATTGKDHWKVLLRARAIETQCYVIAPGQVGKHDDGGLRDSWGHSLIADPWGHVIAEVQGGPGFAVAEIDLTQVATVRQGMPVQEHRRY